MDRLKTSISRKTLHTMSDRQKRRIKSEYRKNICIRSVSNIKSNIHTQSFCSSATQESIGLHYTCNIKIDSENDNIPETTDDTDSSRMSVDICDESDENDVSSYTHSSEIVPFQDDLASCFVNNNVTHVLGNSLLSLLRKHPCFSHLPKDMRTLLNTPRSCFDISAVPPGEYLHFDVEVAIVNSLSNILCTSINEVVLDFNTDGCNLDKQSVITIWPIQCRTLMYKMHH